LVRSLARHAGRALTGTSANRSGRRGARSADEVVSQLRYRVPLVLDSGRVSKSDPSTIVDLTAGPPRILRQGRVSQAAIERALSSRIVQP
ncbi:MAG: Sua5/YciO/YrdC/YwlC family protein, partial [Bryobacterales bacterium]|nr:Sua5/YciO/YrdC/YwlC family protein [Bryobacterales bacterium]